MPDTPAALVRLQRDGDVAVIALCDSARLNPLSIPLQEQLRAQLAEVAQDRRVRALVLTGEGRGFCVGADLSSIGSAPDPADTRSVGDRTADTMQALSNRLVLDLQELPVPVVCAVNGAAAGAGAGLALAGDFTLMAESAYLYFPFLPRLGIVPDLGSTWFLERRAGRARALGAALLDGRITAAQAVDWGLAWAQVPDAALAEQALALAGRLARLPAHAVREARRALDAAATHTLAQQLHYESERQRELVGGPAFLEGVQAFAAKRPPAFQAATESSLFRPLPQEPGMTALFGLMQDRPLMISSLIEHAARFHPHTEIVSRLPESKDGTLHRTDWAGVRREACKVAHALKQLGVQPGERVGTLAWNNYRHLALYFGVSGSGAVLHTVNPRLFPEQIAYIVNHAEDRVMCFDTTFAPLVEKLAPQLGTVKHFVCMCTRATLPQIEVPPGTQLHCWDDLIGSQSADFAWPEFDERTASSLCYTSGTTGHPKGVLYSHRSTLLHSLMELAPDTFGLSSRETVMLIVPMFHANAWGTPYAAAMVGCRLVLPGPHLDGQSVYTLMRDEKVTFSQGVPTVWLMLFQYLDAHPEIDPRQLGIRRIGIGGAAVPRAMLERFEQQFGAEVVQGWGMTETSPIGVISQLLPKHDALSEEERLKIKLKQGRGVWGVDLKLVDDAGEVQPWDGEARGHLRVRGPWIASGYFKGEGGSPIDEEGFFTTGDVANIDADGFLQLVDRAKDVIKSGGEWISSIDVENAAMGHPGVAEAAIIGVAHPKWQERPLLIVVAREGQAVDKASVLDFLSTRIAKWWLPDDVVFVKELPHTATGKLLKTKLREQYRDHRLPDA